MCEGCGLWGVVWGGGGLEKLEKYVLLMFT